MNEVADLPKKEKEVNIPIDPAKYKKTRSPSGGKSLSNGDELADLLEAIPASTLYDVADKVIPGNDFRDKYAKLNNGMQRMNLGNRFRGFVTSRDKENEAEDAKAKSEKRPAKLMLGGMEALAKAVGPARKAADTAIADMNKASEKKKKAAAEKKEAETKKKAK